MSKIGSFVGGFGVGMKMVNDAEDRKRRNDMEDRRFKIEMERAEREKARADEEDAYRRDRKAAGQVAMSGSSGVQGVNIGTQQDSQLAQQNAEFSKPAGEGFGVGTTGQSIDESGVTNTKPTGDYFGAQLEVAKKYGRDDDVLRLTQARANEDARGQETEWKKGRQDLMDEYQKTKKTRQDSLNFYRAVGQHDFRYGKAQLGDLAKVDETAEKLKKEGVFDALQYYWATGDLEGTLDKFDAVGDQKIDRNSVQTSIVKDNVTGQDTPIINGKYQNGQSFTFDPERLSHMVGGYEGYLASRKQSIDAKDKEAGRKHQTDTLNETRRHNKAMEGISRANAKAGSSGKGGSAFKDLSTDDYKSFTTYRDVIKPASGVGGKASVTKEAVIDQEALAKFRAWARAKGYNDMNMALRDWDAEGRPSANAPSQAQAQRQQAPANRRPLSEIFR